MPKLTSVTATQLRNQMVVHGLHVTYLPRSARRGEMSWWRPKGEGKKARKRDGRGGRFRKTRRNLDNQWRASGRALCPTCGKETRMDGFQLDHFRPLSKSGSDDWTNLWPICIACNQRKGTKWGPDDFGEETWAALCKAFERFRARWRMSV